MATQRPGGGASWAEGTQLGNEPKARVSQASLRSRKNSKNGNVDGEECARRRGYDLSSKT